MFLIKTTIQTFGVGKIFFKRLFFILVCLYKSLMLAKAVFI